MNRESLLAHFNRISDVPDATPRLRRFILDLAVRGKLVEQYPSEDSGISLLEQLKKLKIQMLRENNFSREQKVEFPTSDSKTEIPSSWTWAHIDDVAIVQGGKRLPSGATFSKGPTNHIYIRVTDMKNGTINTENLRYIAPDVHRVIAKYTINQRDLYITIAGTIGQVGHVPAFFDGHNLTENAAKIVFRGLNSDYFRMALGSDIVQEQFKDKTKQMAQPKLALKRILGARFPLPPLAEQRRVVAKVDELMALLDRLEASHRERDTRRDWLTAATHHHLNSKADSETLRTNVHFFIRHLLHLTSRPDQIKRLRETILNLAVNGNLVAQRDDDEPVSLLLKRIAQDQEQLVRSRVLKNRPFFVPRPDKVELTGLPTEWRIAVLGQLITFGPQNGISPKTSSRPDAPRAITLTATTSGIFRAEHSKQIDASIPSDSEFWLREGDLLFQRGNTREYVGMAAYYAGPPKVLLYPDLIIKVRLNQSLSLRYIHLCSLAPYARAYFGMHASGAQATMPKINHDILLNLPIPVPPIAEQHRIVAKVDELMSLCDQLEARLTTSKTEASRLLESVLHSALNGQAERQLSHSSA